MSGVPIQASGYALLMSSNKSETRVQCFLLVGTHRNTYARTGRPFKRKWCEYENSYFMGWVKEGWAATQHIKLHSYGSKNRTRGAYFISRLNFLFGSSSSTRYLKLFTSGFKENMRLGQTRGLCLPDEPQTGRNQSWAAEEFSVTCSALSQLRKNIHLVISIELKMWLIFGCAFGEDESDSNDSLSIEYQPSKPTDWMYLAKCTHLHSHLLLTTDSPETQLNLSFVMLLSK
ncbi:hypothetical protein CSKR_102230 [Clonorchis sinensis]|uniref:Uncharacterized protein n=1 Tax=Clonorchis sinensis TaxID=79923 RepID=A0A419PG30_CLOSI|nr:hypothetical protein CSKR_102230 [Clonorchis sinensis]